MFQLKGGYSDLWKAIIRPPRDGYDPEELGPKEFRIKKRNFKRTDLQLTNERGLTLECSHFEPFDNERVAKELPCVIFLHGNCSSRLEALPCLDVLLPNSITVFCLDFAGSGHSGGEYISLGWYERDDVKAVVDHLRDSGSVSTIGLWGRSMGAATALMHAHRDPSIAGLVLDSAFSDLKVLAEELCRMHTKIPKLVASVAMSFIRKTIKSKAKFDLQDISPIKNVDQAFIPALFASAKDDDFILPHHTQKLYDLYAGDKNIVSFDGDHNSGRPDFFFDSAAIFFYNTLQCQLLPEFKRKKTMSLEKKETMEVPKEKFDKLIGDIMNDEEDELLRLAMQASLETFKKTNGSEKEGEKKENGDSDIIKIVKTEELKEVESILEYNMKNLKIEDAKEGEV